MSYYYYYTPLLIILGTVNGIKHLRVQLKGPDLENAQRQTVAKNAMQHQAAGKMSWSVIKPLLSC